MTCGYDTSSYSYDALIGKFTGKELSAPER